MQNGSNRTNGLGFFNLARGVGMALILIGHSMSPFFQVAEKEGVFAGAGDVLGGGIMAMFFLMSGFGFYCRSIKKCWSTQYKLLLRPYLWTAAAILLSKLVLALVKQRPFAEHGGNLVLTYLLGLNAEGGSELFGYPIDSISILWFVLALFISWLIYNGICRLENRKMQIVLVILCVITGWALTLISAVWPLCLPIALIAVGYLAAGREISRRDLLNKKLPLWCWIVIAGIVLLCGAFGQVVIVVCKWKLGLLDVAGSFCVGFLLLRGYSALMRKNWNGIVTRFLETVGFYSIWIVFLHGFEKVIIPWYRLGLFFPEKPALCAVICLILRSCVIFVMMRVIMWIRRKMKKKPSRLIITA